MTNNATKWGDEMMNISENNGSVDASVVGSSVVGSTVVDRRKTALCAHEFGNGNGKCTFGDKCNFAHSFEELRVKECGWGYDCKKVAFDDGKYYNATNAGAKCCNFLHPEETKKNFCFRTERLKPHSVHHSVVKSVKPAVRLEDVSFPSLPAQTEERKAEVKSATCFADAVKSEEPKLATNKTFKNTEDFIIEVDDDGVATISCFSEEHIKVAFKIALESKRSVRIKRRAFK